MTLITNFSVVIGVHDWGIIDTFQSIISKFDQHWSKVGGIIGSDLVGVPIFPPASLPPVFPRGGGGGGRCKQYSCT